MSVLPLVHDGLSLNKEAFRDAICLRYGWSHGWSLPNTPSKCSCGQNFLAYHAMICPTGGFPTIRHNELRDLTASLLTNQCMSQCGNGTEATTTHGESLTTHAAITTDDAHLNIRASGFSSSAQDAYFDVMVFHPHAMSNESGPISVVYRKHEVIKKRAYS